MQRKNKKSILKSEKNLIKQSNELATAPINKNLSIRQRQLFAYAILSTQKDGETKFNKFQFEEVFKLEKIKTEEAIENASLLIDLKMEIKDLKNDKARGYNVFTQYNYDKGKFSFKWNDVFLPHISELKERFVVTDLAIISEFKSRFSWILYEYLKGHYGNWNKELSKDELMNLFNVEDRVSYQKNTNRLKNGVLDVAIEEINEHTELEVWYTEKKTGNKITGFVLHWSTGENINAATEKQLTLLREIHNEVDQNMFDYLSVKNVQRLDQARNYIIKIRDIDRKINEGLSSEQASNYIQDAKHNYLMLESLIEKDGEKRDTSFCYNWLEDVDD